MSPEDVAVLADPWHPLTHLPCGCPNHQCEHDIGQHDGEPTRPVCSAPGCPCRAERGMAV